MATLDDLETAVTSLTASTTSLLDEVNVNKSTLTTSATNAASSAGAASTSATNAAASASSASSSASAASASASAAATSEANAAAIALGDITGDEPYMVPQYADLGRLAYQEYIQTPLGVGTGITEVAICKAGLLDGPVKRLSLLIDLTGLNSGGTAGDIIGADGTTNPCYILHLPSITLLGVTMTCLETPAGGDTDIDLYAATEGTGVEDGAIASLTETLIINAGAQTAGTVTYGSADPAANSYLYLVGQGTANATYTAGRLLIEIYGV
jgi:hypothetical protein